MAETTPLDANAKCRRLVSIISMIGDKWSVMIIMVLANRPHRFNELRRAIGGISQQMLTRALKGLERDGLVGRTVYPTVPPQVAYALTELGQSLSKPVFELGDWAKAHVSRIEANRDQFDLNRD